jgi:hypothetical protein
VKSAQKQAVALPSRLNSFKKRKPFCKISLVFGTINQEKKAVPVKGKIDFVV